jgi:hypothetical protein
LRKLPKGKLVEFSTKNNCERKLPNGKLVEFSTKTADRDDCCAEWQIDRIVYYT